MVPIAEALERVREQYSELVSSEAILSACKRAGHRFRQRLLGPARLIQLFLLQVLHGNTAISHLRLLVDFAFSESAYCQARGRLKLGVLVELFGTIGTGLRRAGESAGRWHGHRVFLVDGTGVSMPDTGPLQTHFGQPGRQKAGCGFPVAHVLAMFDAATGFIIDLVAGPLRRHDLADCPQLHPKLSGGDLLVGDRGFCSYAHLALLLQRNLHGLMRIHQRIIVNFRAGRRHAGMCKGVYKVKGLPTSEWLGRLGRLDQVVRWFKPSTRPRWMDRASYAALPESIVVREFRYRINRPGFRVQEVTAVTTLLDAEGYPAEKLAELYFARWQVETNLRHLKTTLGMDELKCRSVQGVLKELYMFALVYNLVRAVMLKAAARQGVAPERISFVDAWRWLRQVLWREVPLRLKVNPLRSSRCQPRARKRRPKSYPLLTKPRQELLQDLQRQHVKA